MQTAASGVQAHKQVILSAFADEATQKVPPQSEAVRAAVLGLLGHSERFPAYAGQYRLPNESQVNIEVAAAAAQVLARAFKSDSKLVMRATRLAGKLLEVSALIPDQFHFQSEPATREPPGSVTGEAILRVYRAACEHVALNLELEGVLLELKGGPGERPTLKVEPRFPESWGDAQRTQVRETIASICLNVWDVRFHGAELSLEFEHARYQLWSGCLSDDNPNVAIPGYFAPKEA